MTDETNAIVRSTPRLPTSRLDPPAGDEGARALLSRLKRSNRALDNLRHALEVDEASVERVRSRPKLRIAPASPIVE